MSSTPQRSSRSVGRQSLFFTDIATPISSHRGKFATPGQAAAVSALWKENFAGAGSGPDLPPPPMFTLEDRANFSPEPCLGEIPSSPDLRSEGGRTPWTPRAASASPAPKGKGDTGSGGSPATPAMLQQTPQSSNWWSPSQKSGGGGGMDVDEKGKGSPVDGVVQSTMSLMLPPPTEVVKPEPPKNSILIAGGVDEEEWVTVYGFSPGDTNLVLRELEKCGPILKHVPGPRESNYIHVLFQNQYDARKALQKNGCQINSVLIIGVKPVDPMQRQFLNEKLNSSKGGFMTSLPPITENAPRSIQNRPYLLPSSNGSINDSGRRSDGVIAGPTKSIFSKAVDLLFGV